MLQASDRELLWVQRLSIFVIGAAATAMSIYIRTVWGLFVLAADIVYVIVLPQLTCALFVPSTNAYGALTAFLAGAILRIGAGETTLNLPAFIRYPLYDEGTGEQKFPFRLIAFAAAMFCHVVVSVVMATCFKRGWLPAAWNRLGADDNGHEDDVSGQKYRMCRKSNVFPDNFGDGNLEAKNGNVACVRFNPIFTSDVDWQ